MKKIIVVRHAKSSWANIGQADFDRPLNDRGKADAPEMAQKTINKGITSIDAFITSPAKRARKTCKLFVEVFGQNKADIIYVDELYNAPKQAFYNAILHVDDAINTIAIFAHNPGITDFVNSLCKPIYTIEMPTCAVFAAEINITSWKNFETADKNILFYLFPKEE